MSNSMTATKALGQVEAAAAERQDVRDFTRAEVGQAARQGDIYLHRVADDHPRGKRTPGHQLALGNTQGSRHVAEGDCEVLEGTERPSWCELGTFLGPLVVVGEDGATVTHPEHAHVALGPGCYQVTHQMDAATRDRVAD